MNYPNLIDIRRGKGGQQYLGTWHQRGTQGA
jgi:hypothetical protein